MDAPRDTAALAETVERLLDAPGPAARARLLVDAAREALGATAAALCRPIGGAWARLVWAGDPAELPTPDQIEAVVDGVLDPHLPPRRYVLAAEEGLALALAGVAAGEEELDAVGALLVAYALVADGDAGGGLDEVPGAAG